MIVWHHSANSLGKWHSRRQLLRDGNWDGVWIEHPTGASVDVVALRIELTIEEDAYAVDLTEANADLQIFPASPVSIIGFPYQLTPTGKFPVWKTGHVASDPDLDALGKPVLLIDATTKPGMSGSPVYASHSPFYVDKIGDTVCGRMNRFLGIYSGHYEKVDVGRVWKPHVLAEILANA